MVRGGYLEVSRNFTLLYGARISFIRPQHDVSGVANTFLPSAFVGSQAPRLFTPAVVNGKSVVVNPITQEVVPNSYATLIVPGSGNLTNGILFPGKGVPDTILISQGELFQPRLGVSWDVTGKGTTVLRAGAGTALAEFAKVSQTPGAKVEDSELSTCTTDRSLP